MAVFWRALMMVLLVFPTLPLIYFILVDECKPKKNIVVGVTLPWEGQRDEAVLALLGRYKKEMGYVCWLLLAATVPMLFVRSTGVYMTLLMTWVVALCVVIMIPYVRCNRGLRKLKEERGWRRDAEDAPVTDLKVAAVEMKWLSPWWFLPPFIISLVPLAFDRSLWWLWALDAAIVPVCYLIYRYLYRNRAEVVDEDSGRTLALTRIRRYNWGKCWIVIAWSTGLFNVGLWLTLEHVWWCMAVVLAYGMAVCVAVAGVEFRVRRLQEKLTADSGLGYYVDEDDRWIWGMFYYNPNDAKMFINNRVGMGTTVNMARRPAQIMMGLCLALVLACPLLGIWLIGMEHAPVELEVTEDAVIGSHYGGHWSVALTDIAEIELIDQRPRLFRIAGVGMDSALTGQFNADGWGRITCCIDPRTGPWLRVKTTDGQIFLFGASREGAAAAVAAALE